MNKIVTSGKTVEAAVKQGLAKLGTTEDKVAVNVLEQPSKGFLGLIGVKEAKVELTLLEETVSEPLQGSRSSHTVPVAALEDEVSNERDPYEEAASFVRDVGENMGLQVNVEIEHKKDNTVLNISGSDLGLLIGRRGQTLDALQYLANIIANRYSDSFVRIVLDAENFRERRRKTLEDLAVRLAGRVVRTRKELALEPMSPQERKVIHSKLQDHPEVKTYSKGEEPNRRVVIALKQSK
ncbi:RNA-binding cell elongation regulator Jag/EloR [Paenibacillus sp. FSL W8-0186]|uniref:RNA-binding protein KhpB n=1 Tax=Paenibacillus woosongensis TaxID=307580 RepID=A0A7X3CQG3_9BACL|nr:RNA-binding cell elongation regulator Jag/EloR [Paenibacillus woosongensis]MUG47879.1 KH domain-containing protein [Paenibacillus woosongensis]GIP59156.1 DNA-binding protein [Paenibacillus woosongensis]